MPMTVFVKKKKKTFGAQNENHQTLYDSILGIVVIAESQGEMILETIVSKLDEKPSL